MAGTKTQAEALPSFLVSTILSASSTPQNSLEGLDPTMLVNRSLVWVEENDSIYRWEDQSTATANGSSIVRPSALAPADPGRFFLATTHNSAGQPITSAQIFSPLDNPGATTTITSANVVAALAGTWTRGTSPAYDTDFTITTGGLITYNGNKNYLGLIQVSGEVDVVTGTNQDFNIFLDKDNAFPVGSGSSGPLLTGITRAISGRLNISFIDEVEIENGSTYQLKVVNLSNDADLQNVANARSPQVLIRDIGLPLL